MKSLCLIPLLVLTSQAVEGADSNGVPNSQAPVLKKYEPTDSVVITLPGLASAAIPSGLPATEVHLAPPPPDPERPVLRRPKREFPPEFERDSAEYLGQQIGIWQQVDAQVLLGEPTRQRSALADDQTVNGQILAFEDPTGRYRELELDFDRETGNLRTLFAYPHAMTWQECRQAFGGNVKSTEAKKGRMFYSYVDRRLDVLVDASGKVISLGMY